MTKITIEGRADLGAIVQAALDAGRFTVHMKTTPKETGGALVEVETVYVDVLGVVARAVDPVPEPLPVDFDMNARVIAGSDYERMTLFADVVHDYGHARGWSPGENVVSRLETDVELIRAGHVLVSPQALRVDPSNAIPRHGLREYIESQIADEAEQMRVYGNVISFIDEAVAAAQPKADPVRVEMPSRVQPPMPEGFDMAPPFKSDGVVSSEVSPADDAATCGEGVHPWPPEDVIIAETIKTPKISAGISQSHAEAHAPQPDLEPLDDGQPKPKRKAVRPEYVLKGPKVDDPIEF